MSEDDPTKSTVADTASPRERVLKDKDGSEFVVVNNPRGDGNCAVNVIVDALIRLGFLPPDFTARKLRDANAAFTRDSPRGPVA
jgi:hypothetical protein